MKSAKPSMQLHLFLPYPMQDPIQNLANNIGYWLLRSFCVPGCGFILSDCTYIISFNVHVNHGRAALLSPSGH